MDITQVKYNGEFTVEERKAMTAQMLQELRKTKKMSQKEVAAYLNIPATTYNTYESGRSEPPLEILVRLSYLYQMSIDFIVQRDRTFRTTDDLSRQIADYKEQIAEVNRAIDEQGQDSPAVKNLALLMEKVLDAMTDYTQSENIKNAIDSTTRK